MIKEAKNVKRESDGYWIHPDIPLWEEGTTWEEIKKWAAKNLIKVVIIDFEDTASDEQIENYYEKGLSGYEDWEPEYEKENTFELCYYESDSGPHFMYALKTPEYIQLEKTKEKLKNF